VRLESLILLLHIEQLGTISAASAMAHISQPTASSQIKKLEQELGVAIFHRNCPNNKLSFTSSGKLILSYAKRFTELEGEMRANLVSARPSTSPIIIATGLSVGTYIVPYIVKSFKRKFPAIRYVVKMSPGTELLDILEQKHCQIVLSTVNPKTNKFNVIPFFDDELFLASPVNMDIPDTIDVNDLKNYPVILREPSSISRSIIEKSLKKHGIFIRDLRVEAEFYSTEAIKRSIETGSGVGFLPHSAISNFSAESAYKIIDIRNISIRRTVNIIYRKKESLLPAIKYFIDFAVYGDWRSVSAYSSVKNLDSRV
jgi:DNA-binding transcriptional LysR family regulator